MEIENSSVAKAPFKSAEWLQKKKEHKAVKHSKQNKNLKQICSNELTNSQRINYLHLDAPAPTKPVKKYCDITGFESKYKDGSSGLNYADKFVYAHIKTISRPIVDQYLGLRKITPPGSK